MNMPRTQGRRKISLVMVWEKKLDVVCGGSGTGSASQFRRVVSSTTASEGGSQEYNDGLP